MGLKSYTELRDELATAVALELLRSPYTRMAKAATETARALRHARTGPGRTKRTFRLLTML
jgi:hypothetical protein